jgi:hypothetical protein
MTLQCNSSRGSRNSFVSSISSIPESHDSWLSGVFITCEAGLQVMNTAGCQPKLVSNIFFIESSTLGNPVYRVHSSQGIMTRQCFHHLKSRLPDVFTTREWRFSGVSLGSQDSLVYPWGVQSLMDHHRRIETPWYIRHEGVIWTPGIRCKIFKNVPQSLQALSFPKV